MSSLSSQKVSRLEMEANALPRSLQLAPTVEIFAQRPLLVDVQSQTSRGLVITATSTQGPKTL